MTTIADPRDILRPGHLREVLRTDRGRHLHLLVHPDSNKTQIKIAVEKVFGVTVTSVNTANRQGKRKRTRFGTASARTPSARS